MCWMLTVVMTAMPASRILSTSSHRFSCRPESGTFVWASSSMRTTSGRRTIHCIEVHLLPDGVFGTRPACVERRGGHGSVPRCRRACASPRTRRRRLRPAGIDATLRRASRTFFRRRPPHRRYTRNRPVGRTPSSSPFTLISTFAGPRHCVGTLGRRSDGRKAVTDVKPGKLVTKGRYQHNLVGVLVTLAGLGALVASDAAVAPPPEHRDSCVAPRPAGAPRRRDRWLPAGSSGHWAASSSTTSFPSAVQHAHGQLAPELDRPRVYVGGPVWWPSWSHSCGRPFRRPAAYRGIGASVRTLPGPHRRPHPLPAADAHRGHRAGCLHAALDGADASRPAAVAPWPVRCSRSPHRRARP